MCFIIKKLYLSAEPNRDKQEDAVNFNTDVIAVVEEDDEGTEGEIVVQTVKYVASFFTYDNINELHSQHVKTGEFLNGKYFYAKNMVLIDNCSLENIRTVIDNLVTAGEFREVFRRI